MKNDRKDQLPPIRKALKSEHTRHVVSFKGKSKTGHISEAHLAALGWAFTDLPTIQGYQRCTGENVAITFWKYRQWAEENLIGGPS